MLPKSQSDTQSDSLVLLSQPSCSVDQPTISNISKCHPGELPESMSTNLNEQHKRNDEETHPIQNPCEVADLHSKEAGHPLKQGYSPDSSLREQNEEIIASSYIRDSCKDRPLGSNLLSNPSNSIAQTKTRARGQSHSPAGASPTSFTPSTHASEGLDFQSDADSSPNPDTKTSTSGTPPSGTGSKTIASDFKSRIPQDDNDNDDPNPRNSVPNASKQTKRVSFEDTNRPTVPRKLSANTEKPWTSPKGTSKIPPINLRRNPVSGIPFNSGTTDFIASAPNPQSLDPIRRKGTPLIAPDNGIEPDPSQESKLPLRSRSPSSRNANPRQKGFDESQQPARTFSNILPKENQKESEKKVSFKDNAGNILGKSHRNVKPNPLVGPKDNTSISDEKDDGPAGRDTPPSRKFSTGPEMAWTSSKGTLKIPAIPRKVSSILNPGDPANSRDENNKILAQKNPTKSKKGAIPQSGTESSPNNSKVSKTNPAKTRAAKRISLKTPTSDARQQDLSSKIKGNLKDPDMQSAVPSRTRNRSWSPLTGSSRDLPRRSNPSKAPNTQDAYSELRTNRAILPEPQFTGNKPKEIGRWGKDFTTGSEVVDRPAKDLGSSSDSKSSNWNRDDPIDNSSSERQLAKLSKDLSYISNTSHISGSISNSLGESSTSVHGISSIKNTEDLFSSESVSLESDKDYMVQLAKTAPNECMVPKSKSIRDRFKSPTNTVAKPDTKSVGPTNKRSRSISPALASKPVSSRRPLQSFGSRTFESYDEFDASKSEIGARITPSPRLKKSSQSEMQVFIPKQKKKLSAKMQNLFPENTKDDDIDVPKNANENDYKTEVPKRNSKIRFPASGGRSPSTTAKPKIVVPRPVSSRISSPSKSTSKDPTTLSPCNSNGNSPRSSSPSVKPPPLKAKSPQMKVVIPKPKQGERVKRSGRSPSPKSKVRNGSAIAQPIRNPRSTPPLQRLGQPLPTASSDSSEKGNVTPTAHHYRGRTSPRIALPTQSSTSSPLKSHQTSSIIPEPKVALERNRLSPGVKSLISSTKLQAPSSKSPQMNSKPRWGPTLKNSRDSYKTKSSSPSSKVQVSPSKSPQMNFKSRWDPTQKNSRDSYRSRSPSPSSKVQMTPSRSPQMKFKPRWDPTLKNSRGSSEIRSFSPSLTTERPPSKSPQMTFKPWWDHSLKNRKESPKFESCTSQQRSTKIERSQTRSPKMKIMVPKLRLTPERDRKLLSRTRINSDHAPLTSDNCSNVRTRPSSLSVRARSPTLSPGRSIGDRVSPSQLTLRLRTPSPISARGPWDSSVTTPEPRYVRSTSPSPIPSPISLPRDRPSSSTRFCTSCPPVRTGPVLYTYNSFAAEPRVRYKSLEDRPPWILNFKPRPLFSVLTPLDDMKHRRMSIRTAVRHVRSPTYYTYRTRFASAPAETSSYLNRNLRSPGLYSSCL